MKAFANSFRVNKKGELLNKVSNPRYEFLFNASMTFHEIGKDRFIERLFFGFRYYYK